MQQLQTIESLRMLRQNYREARERVAFVPTMGNLHEGHLRLVDHAKTLADRVIVSIFVNPMQFGQHEDLEKYPRTLEADATALEQRGVDALFTPTADLIYPKGINAQTFVEVPEISHILCGSARPGHFRGVATVVSKLFNMVQPEHAVFGKKDYQQLRVIRLMTEDLSLPITIHGVDTERDHDGLALSSRNGYLSAAEREKAACVYQVLQAMAQGLRLGQDIKELEMHGRHNLIDAGFQPDYVTIRRQEDLQPAHQKDRSLVILIAAYLGKTRLIDNLEVSR